MKRISLLVFGALLVAHFGATNATAGPLADYGDAPDPTYPSLFTSAGPYHGDTTREWLGPPPISTTTVENDSKQIDLDNDDGSAYYLSGPSGNWFHTTVSYNPNLSAASDLRYLNVLVDANNNGAWDGTRTEWIVRNYSVRMDTLPAGVTTADVFLRLPAGVNPNSIANNTTRVTLGEHTVANGSGAWGQFQRGETEDSVPVSRGGSGTPPVNPLIAGPIGPKLEKVRTGGGKWILKAPWTACNHGTGGAQTPIGAPANTYDWQVNVPTGTTFLDVALNPVPGEPHPGEAGLVVASLTPPGGGVIGAGVNLVNQVTPGQLNTFTGLFACGGAPCHDARTAIFNLVYDPDGLYFIVSNNNGVPFDPAFDSPSSPPSPGDYGSEVAMFAIPTVPEPTTWSLLALTAITGALKRRR